MNDDLRKAPDTWGWACLTGEVSADVSHHTQSSWMSIWYLFRMLLIVETQTSHGFHVVNCERSKQQPNISHLVGDFMLSEDFALDDPRLCRFGDISDTLGENCISVIRSAILCQKSDKSLRSMLAEGVGLIVGVNTLKVAIFLGFLDGGLLSPVPCSQQDKSTFSAGESGLDI